MSGKCSNQHCDAPEIACNLGEEPYTTCPEWRKGAESAVHAEPEEIQAQNSNELLLPWTANSLGTLDLEFVSARSQQALVGVVGPHNAGKTTLLTMIYLLLSQGRSFSTGTFAGSYSLEGWENLAYYLRWKGSVGPTFPPHTSRSTGRWPGLLHLALRSSRDECRDVLFTDAPGEWFTRWSIDRDAADAAGARWVHEHSYSFILVADSDALQGPKRGEARGALLEITRRLSDNLNGRRVAVVWTKADKQVPEGIKSALCSNFDRLFPNWKDFSVKVQWGNGAFEATEAEFRTLFDWTLLKRDPLHDLLRLPTLREDDPFIAFRGR